MSTFLGICQDLCGDVGIAQGYAVPTTVLNQTGELARIVKYVRNAYTWIQNKHENWRWLRVGFTLTTVADDGEYAYTDATDVLTSAAISRFKQWRLDDKISPPKIYLQSAGVGTENFLTWVPWEFFQTVYKIGSQTSATPGHISVDPQNNLVLGPAPSDVFIATGDYYRSNQNLAADADEPEMPADYHDLIKFKAMEYYGLYESAPEVLEMAKEGKDLLRALEKNQLPTIRVAGPMA